CRWAAPGPGRSRRSSWTRSWPGWPTWRTATRAAPAGPSSSFRTGPERGRRGGGSARAAGQDGGSGVEPASVLRLEQDPAVASLVLGHVQRLVGGAYQLFPVRGHRRGAGPRHARQPRRDGHPPRHTAEHEWLGADAFAQPLADRLGLRGVQSEAGQQELLAAPARQAVAAAGLGRQAPRDLGQYLVALVVAPGVVDRLEPVHV